MQTGYGPALLLGVLIGGAILLDDVSTPERKGPAPRVAMIHHDGSEFELTSPGESSDHNVWIVKGNQPAEAEIHKEMEFHVRSQEADSSDHEELMISVNVDAQKVPGKDLHAAIRAAIDAARAEGRGPTEAEIEAAVTAAIGEVNNIDIRIETDQP